MRHSLLMHTLAIVAALLSCSFCFAQPDTLRLVPLGEIDFVPDPDGITLPDWSVPSGTFGLNNDTSSQSGHPPAAVFNVKDGSSFRAFVALPLGGYDQSPGIYELLASGTGVTDVVVHDINDFGVAVGQVHRVVATEDEEQAVYWELAESDPPWTATEISPLPTGSGWSRAVAVSNDDPAVVIVHGQDERDIGCSCASTLDGVYLVSWRVELDDIDYKDLLDVPDCSGDTISPDRSAVGRDICDAADGVAGHTAQGFSSPVFCTGPCVSEHRPDRAIHWSGTSDQVLTDIDEEPEELQAQGRGINRSGNMVGFGRIESEDPGEACEKRAHFWSSPTAPFVNLEAPTAGNESHAEALNDPSPDPIQVVGWDEDEVTAILWENDGGWAAHDLHGLILGTHPESIPQAHDINDQGWIIVYALLDDPVEDEHHAWILVPIECPGDVDDDGSVGFSDLLAVLNGWDTTCDLGVLCSLDLDGDRIVGFNDLLLVLNNWGPCPGTSGSADECADHDLGENCECRDTLLDLIENGTNAEANNARCWLDHYLSDHCSQGCNEPQPDCPDDDPCGKH